MLFKNIQMNAQNHAKNNKPKLPSHKKETCSFIFLFNLQLPPHYLTHSACSQTCATCHLGEKPGLHPDYFQPHVPQQESTNISCIIISSHSCLQTITSDKYKTLLQSIAAKKSKQKKSFPYSYPPAQCI